MNNNQAILNSKIYGEGLRGTPLIVLHGLFGMLDNWGTFGREVGELRPVHLLDLRNHGRSFHSDEMSIAAMVEDLRRYMDFHGFQKAAILGHSLGGRVVMQFALSHPERVEELISADMGPKAYPPHHQGIFKALESLDVDHLTSRKQAEEILKKYIPSFGVVQFLLKNLYWTDDKKLALRFNLPVLHQSYEGLVSEELSRDVFSGRTLFISGGNSGYVKPTDEFYIRERFPQAVFKYLIGADHWLHAEKPDEFREDVLEFLNK